MSATSLELIRNWLPFGRRRSTRADVAALRDWLDGLVGAPAPIVAQALLDKLRVFIVEERNRHARLKLLEAFYGEARHILPGIEATLSSASLPLPAVARQAALATDGLLEELAAGYASLGTGGRAAHPRLLDRIACTRQIACLARRQEIACRSYASISENCWRQLHAAYAAARRGGFADFADGDCRLESLYVGALLLAYADPSRFSRHDLAGLCAAVARYAPLVSVGANAGPPGAARPAALFVVAAEKGDAGRRYTADVAALAARETWLIDCRALVAVLERVIAAGDAAGEAEFPPQLLGAVLEAWRGPPTRRHARQKFRPRVDLFVGFNDVFATLAAAARRTAPAAERPSEWAVLDESPDGFGLRYLRGEAHEIQVGQLVGLRLRERDPLTVCRVRRVVNAGLARLEVGLQTLAPRAIPLTIGSVPAVLLPSLPARTGAAGLIVPAGSAIGGEPVEDPQSRQAWHAERRLEMHPHYEIWRLEPLA